jgi:2-dehydropantoate 2-reductase
MDNPGETIYIIGRGAIGKALAVFLAVNNRKVVLLRGSVDDGLKHTEEFQVTLNNSVELTASVEVSTLSAVTEMKGIVVITNKSFGNADLARALKTKITDSPLVILQNGLGVEQPFVDAGYPAVYRCVLFVTSQNLSQSAVRFKPVSACPIGVVKGNDSQLSHITSRLTTEHFQFRTEIDIEYVTWRKAIINCAFNSICPLLETDNGIFHRDNDALALARQVITECSMIANKKGITINPDDVMENLLLISRSSDGQLISTLQDIRAGQRTEIDTLNFAVARVAEEMGLTAQVSGTKLLGELTRLKARLVTT